MRIRKNARVLLEERNSYLICKLNRSPWDDDSFFSQLVEEGWDIGLPINGSLAQSNLVSDSNPSGDSMELSFEYMDNHVVQTLGKKIEVAESQQPPLVPVLPPQPKKRGRPKKSKQVAAGVSSGGGERNDNDNRYSFYYYSGFGPSWSKKRGTLGNNNSNINKKNNRSTTKRRKKNDYNASKHKNHNSNCNSNEIEEDGIINKKSKIGGAETVYDEQLDYIEDEFDDDDNEEDGGVRARPRKPIKARSLKSLM